LLHVVVEMLTMCVVDGEMHIFVSTLLIALVVVKKFLDIGVGNMQEMREE